MDKEKVTVKEANKVEAVQGKLTYEDKVIQKIIGISLEEVEGLLTVDGGFFSNLAGKLVNTDDVTSGIDVEVGEKQVAVDLDIVAEYGKDIHKIYNEMKEIITKEVKNMTGLEVIEVNVNVVDIKTEEQHEEDSVTLQDKMG
ncbi:Asp23/Gls24 family envelope stress response protein, partial [Enterococcus faecalis]